MQYMKTFLIGAAACALLVGCASPALCPVSGEGLTSMGGPFLVEYKGEKVKLCCEGCKEDFEKDPQKFLKIIAGDVPYPKTEE